MRGVTDQGDAYDHQAPLAASKSAPIAKLAIGLPVSAPTFR
jgi:hypothetical protein